MDIQNLQTSALSMKMQEISSKTEFQAKTNVNNNGQPVNNQRVDITTDIMEFQMEIQIKTLNSFKEQGAVATKSQNLKVMDFETFEYKGKPITELTQDEAQVLIEDEGFFSINNTSNRIADFVIEQSGDDLEKLKSGREGILRGFEEAEKFWGDSLPDIAYDTLDAVLERIDEMIGKMGGSIMDLTA
ncbi:MAG: hydrogenase-4 component G [Candidatus Magnetomorum sp.]|nr:hydrogenase-4 component G [Candidatus Magnetomorum sp.]